MIFLPFGVGVDNGKEGGVVPTTDRRRASVRLI